MILSVCPSAKKVQCSHANCVLQPFCACARTAVAEETKLELRIWLIIGLCALCLIAGVFLSLLVR